MDYIETLADLEAHYGAPKGASLRKVLHHITPLYRKWIMASRLCMLTTVGPEGTDNSPRGDEGPVVQELDDKTLALPDWRGNNRLDSMRNIVRDGRVSLLFLVPGADNVVRINGRARISVNEQLRARFSRGDKLPATVIVIQIEELYTQCARALMRARLWTCGDESAGLPSVGALLAEATGGEEGGASYDDAWTTRAEQTLW